jgi:hypothetical protein
VGGCILPLRKVTSKIGGKSFAVLSPSFLSGSSGVVKEVCLGGLRDVAGKSRLTFCIFGMREL